jgi:hypothetical protein
MLIPALHHRFPLSSAPSFEAPSRPHGVGWKPTRLSKSSSKPMPRPVKEPVNVRHLDAEATAALEEARNMPPGPERTEALKRAGVLRKAADLHRPLLPRRGRPRK